MGYRQDHSLQWNRYRCRHFYGPRYRSIEGSSFTDKGGRKDAFAIEGSLVDEKAQDMGELFVGNTQTALGRKDGPVGSDFVARKAVAAWCKGRARLAALKSSTWGIQGPNSFQLLPLFFDRQFLIP